MNYKLLIGFDGGKYYGFQKQPHDLTVQEMLETSISQIFDEKIDVIGCSRTDRGVHANNMVVNFHSEKEFSCDQLKYILNRLLGETIVVKKAEIVAEDFHARFWCKKKTYRYLLNLGEKNPLTAPYCFRPLYAVEMKKLIEAGNLFLGYHMFFNFCSSDNDNKGYKRTIFSIDYLTDGDQVQIVFVGDGFKKYMVRFIVGTMLEYSYGRINQEYIVSRLDTDTNDKTQFKAPACGLYLDKVEY